MTTLVAEQTRRDRDDEGDRRRGAGRSPLVYVKTALLLGALGTRRRASRSASRSRTCVDRLLRLDVLRRSTSASASTGASSSSACSSALLGAGARGAAGDPPRRRACRCARRSRRPAPRSAAQDAGDAALRRVALPAADDADRPPQRRAAAAAQHRDRRSWSRSPSATCSRSSGSRAAITHVTHERVAATTATTSSSATPSDHPLDARAEQVDPRDARRRDASSRCSTTDGQAEGRRRIHLGRSAGDRCSTTNIVDGRWYTPAEERSHARVAVIEPQPRARHRHARRRPRHRGDRQRAADVARDRRSPRTSRRTAPSLFVPLATMRALLRRRPRGATTTGSARRRATTRSIDRTTTRLEDTLNALGYEVGTEITYVGERDNVAANRTITTSIAVLGFLDRRDQHGRPRERDHDERDRADTRGRHPALRSARAPATSAASSRPRASCSRSPAGCSGSRSATRSTASSCGWSRTVVNVEMPGHLPALERRRSPWSEPSCSRC